MFDLGVADFNMVEYWWSPPPYSFWNIFFESSYPASTNDLKENLMDDFLFKLSIVFLHGTIYTIYVVGVGHWNDETGEIG